MNQILSTESYSEPTRTQKVSQRERIAPQARTSRSNTKTALDMRMIIIIFSVLAIVFALIIVGAKIIGSRKNKNNKNPGVIEILNKPEITIERQKDICILKVDYEEGVKDVTFWWNEDGSTKINYNGASDFFVKNIAIPEGDKNIIHVKATGMDNSSEEIEKDISKAATVGTTSGNKPEVDWKYNLETKEIIITAKSEKGIVDLSYRWGEEEIKTITNEREGQKELQAVEKARLGINKLYITATDSEGNTACNENDTIIGVLDPEVSIDKIQDAVDENTGELIKVMFFTVHHDSGFKKIIVQIEGREDIVYDEETPDYDAGKQNVKFADIFNPNDIVNMKVIIYTNEMPEVGQEIADRLNLKEISESN